MQQEIREVLVPTYISLDSELTSPCQIPTFPTDKEITYGDVVTHSVEMMGSVEECNARFTAIRQLQDTINNDD